MASATWLKSSLDESAWQSIFYTGYTTIRTAIVTPMLLLLAFAALRIAGTRTLTQATLFGRIVSVAVGSIVAGSALRPNTPLTASVVATAVILGLTLAINEAYAAGIIPGHFMHSRPVLVFAHGQALKEQMHHCLITQDKLDSEVRSHGYSSWVNVFAVVVEPNGSFSVISNDAASAGVELLQNVRGFKEHINSTQSSLGVQENGA